MVSAAPARAFWAQSAQVNAGSPVPLWEWLVPVLCAAAIAASGLLIALLVRRGRWDGAQPDTAASRAGAVRLTVTDPHGDTAALERVIDQALFVGRGAANDLVFDDPLMGEQQFVIENKDGAYTVTGLSTLWDTSVNGERAGIAYPLYHGDVIVAGRQVILFEQVDSPDQRLLM